MFCLSKNEKMLLVIKMYYKERLKDLREQLEIKQSDIAKFLNISNKTYSAYEIEYEIIPVKHLVLLVDYLNTSVDYLFGFSKNKNYDIYIKEIKKKLAGKRLKSFRKENKITQTKLANELNTTFSVISGYEIGRRLIGTPFLYDICKKYHISADYLLGKIDSPKYLK